MSESGNYSDGTVHQIRAWIAWKIMPVSEREVEKQLAKTSVEAEKIRRAEENVSSVKDSIQIRIAHIEDRLGMYPTRSLDTDTCRSEGTVDD